MQHSWPYLLCHPKLSLARGSPRETAKGGGESYKTTPCEKLMSFFPLLLVLYFGYYLSNKLPINPRGAGPDPPLIPLSGSACTALSDNDTTEKKATTDRALSGS